MGRMQVGGVSVDWLEQGSGEPVVLLHSTGASGAQWRALVERLAQRHHVLVPDLLGYGATGDWGGNGAFSLAHEGAIVAALLDRVHEPAHLVGHSYGGAVALHVARAQPQRVRSLALFEPVAFHLLRTGDPLDEAALREVSEAAAFVAHAHAAGDADAAAACFVDYWSGPGTWTAMPPARRDAMASRVGKVVLDFQAVFREPVCAQEFQRLRLPTLLMQGDRSPLSARRVSRLLSRTLPAVRTVTFRGAGHMAPLTHRDEVNEQIVAHLAACRPARATAGDTLAA
ncbi:alpha/beta hydrolase [Piscinibacter sp. XHJ-5]|uniref:alpha/beta fold hydrolase n=1 Tax=Piscinibacter sp. XHJ-5 TaxID=3037797 RepID=UPI002452F84B|nr:alpha/beta hydrolase [Piscinibacter sp. XHJ-5]